MARCRRQRLPAEPVTARVVGLAHDARGVGHVEGKAVFIDGALAGELVRFRYVKRRRSYDEGTVVEVLEPASDRVEPRCVHFGVCGGCSLQHLDPAAQIRAKQAALLDNLRRIGAVEPTGFLPPLTGPVWGYRRRARLGVRHVVKKGRVLVGFRERHSGFVSDLSRCEVLDPRVGGQLPALAELIQGLSVFDKLPQIEVAAGDEAAALVFRHLAPLTDADRQALARFGASHGLQIHLQPAGPGSVQPLWPEAPEPLTYRHPAFDVELAFAPLDFTQVNAEINRKMVERAIELLDPQPGERVLDLFCGLGNFTLPLARRAGRVVGVEGDEALVARARGNARRNGIGDTEFHALDLTAPPADAAWTGEGFHKALLDPPRSGALEAVHFLGKIRPRRIVYVSCHPATLARDAGVLVREYGYRLERAGVMDMFPHTAHVESIALFEGD